ncbi:hypothetical protein [Rhodoferax sp.]|uniref:hypothetical protein n=1 Tax=Rhodoferax sp. TaxID=50421 RepID=UPI001EBFF0C5|nr:hypothetical protein [Rhodoferax sp.]MBT9506677.1 hypothetical protein [Rhodoferax sp.]
MAAAPSPIAKAASGGAVQLVDPNAAWHIQYSLVHAWLHGFSVRVPDAWSSPHE